MGEDDRPSLKFDSGYSLSLWRGEKTKANGNGHKRTGESAGNLAGPVVAHELCMSLSPDSMAQPAGAHPIYPGRFWDQNRQPCR